MDYRKVGCEIFGTDDIDEWRKTAEKARRYDLWYGRDEVHNVRGAGRKKAVAEEEAEAMYARHKEGIPVQKIAEEFHVTRPTVYKYLKHRSQWEKEQGIRIRMDYMYRDQLCSVIEVDFRRQRVYVENNTEKVMLKAFGVNDHPDWEDFQLFLESRCFPRSRCQAKRILRESGLDAYDPLQIIEKTMGRMAEDHHWIRLYDKDEGGFECGK